MKQTQFLLKIIVIFSLIPFTSYAQGIHQADEQKLKVTAKISKNASSLSAWSTTKIWTIVGLSSVAVVGGAVAAGGGGGSGSGGDDNSSQNFGTLIDTTQNCTANNSNFQTSEYNSQYGLTRINAASAYNAGCSGSGITVAVVDTGVNLSHPDLAANIISNGYDFADNDSNPNSDGSESHGTHVAGIIAAVKNNSAMHGVAYNADILPIKITATANGNFTSNQNIGLAINYAVNNGAKVINNSWGTPTRDTDYIGNSWYQDFSLDINDFADENDLRATFGNAFINSFEYAAAQNVITVFATGNEGNLQTSIQAALPFKMLELKGHWLAVGAVDSNNNIASFSNRCGVAQDWCLVAPGVNILSTIDPADNIDSEGNPIDLDNDGYEYFSGTSMAAPHVSGAVAVLMEQFPNLTNEEIIEILLTTATDLGAAGVDAVYGYGLLNLGAAVSPIGPIYLSLNSDINGAAIPLNSSQISNGIFANAFANQKIESAILDKYKRTYNVDLSQYAAADQSKNFYNLFSNFNKKYQKTILPISPNSQFTFFRNTQKNFSNNIDPKDLSSFSFSSKIDDQSNFVLNYNINMRQAFNFGVINEVKDQEILQLTQESASSNPFLNFAENGFNSVFAIGNEDSKIRLASFFADQKDEFFDENGELQNLNKERKTNGFAAEYVQNFDESSVALQFGQMNETGSFLGAVNEGAFALDDKVTTYFANISGRLDLSAKTTFYGNYNYGVSLPQTTQNSLIFDISKVVTSSFGVSLVQKDFVKTGNDFGLAISQPLRIENGQANLNLPVGRTMSGEMLRQNMLLNLNSTGREIDFESFYKFALDKSSDLKGKFLYRTSPNHDKNAENEGIFFLGYSKSF